MSRLRVIAGTARGRKLRLVPGDSTRPITDRVKESLFNILSQDIPASRWLDLFAGTGSVGIEALSRGAEFVRFIDRNKQAFDTVQYNLELTGLEEQAQLLLQDAFATLARQPDKQFDYIYIAPPQYKDMWHEALKTLDENPDWMVEDAWVIVQIDPVEYQQVQLQNLSEFDQRRYGSTLLVFYERQEHSNDHAND
ncbi:MAG: 16S rRNA (guanine(966)-N(2))-methyltransferase RsmD [Chloroflexi bacterium]|nr:MAG: 16S rRNA (guanine(966)-N(2))-methyltransferase RsmD [Chloroflexota bacterium]MBL1193526.1 16S rRNA (guanine(966)-N(2))-methyltransferase RsmD [Chloroflexota bacterium]NOH10817.1 16S rRNA (guanine(966)-N(2))-methyltransferase RsmD [Chloroflexota bacterium]